MFNHLIGINEYSKDHEKSFSGKTSTIIQCSGQYAFCQNQSPIETTGSEDATVTDMFVLELNKVKLPMGGSKSRLPQQRLKSSNG